jgi:hypothetical protein
LPPDMLARLAYYLATGGAMVYAALLVLHSEGF